MINTTEAELNRCKKLLMEACAEVLEQFPNITPKEIKIHPHTEKVYLVKEGPVMLAERDWLALQPFIGSLSQHYLKELAKEFFTHFLEFEYVSLGLMNEARKLKNNYDKVRAHQIMFLIEEFEKMERVPVCINKPKAESMKPDDINYYLTFI